MKKITSVLTQAFFTIVVPVFFGFFVPIFFGFLISILITNTNLGIPWAFLLSAFLAMLAAFSYNLYNKMRGSDHVETDKKPKELMKKAVTVTKEDKQLLPWETPEYKEREKREREERALNRKERLSELENQMKAQDLWAVEFIVEGSDPIVTNPFYPKIKYDDVNYFDEIIESKILAEDYRREVFRQPISLSFPKKEVRIMADKISCINLVLVKEGKSG